jgi:hypothetical protein
MKNLLAASYAASAFLCFGAAAQSLPPAGNLTLEKAMADPDWIGAPVRDPFWSVDGKSVYYTLKRAGSPISDQHRVALADFKDRLLEPSQLANTDAPAVYDRAGKRAAFVRNGDVFVRELGNGRLMQITRTPQTEADPQFSADGRLLSFRVGKEWFVHDFDRDLTMPIAAVKAEADPNAARDAAAQLLDPEEIERGHRGRQKT